MKILFSVERAGVSEDDNILARKTAMRLLKGMNIKCKESSLDSKRAILAYEVGEQDYGKVQALIDFYEQDYFLEVDNSGSMRYNYLGSFIYQRR